MWFTETSSGKIGAVARDGRVTEYPTSSPGSVPEDIVRGPDGRMWFSEQGMAALGAITGTGVVRNYQSRPAVQRSAWPSAPTDGCGSQNSSATASARSPTSCANTEYPLPVENAAPHDITAGPDGRLWFTEPNTGQIGAITPSGVVTEYSVAMTRSGVRDIVSGPDGRLWFSEFTANKIGAITTTGKVQEI